MSGWISAPLKGSRKRWATNLPNTSSILFLAEMSGYSLISFWERVGFPRFYSSTLLCWFFLLDLDSLAPEGFMLKESLCLLMERRLMLDWDTFDSRDSSEFEVMFFLTLLILLWLVLLRPLMLLADSRLLPLAFGSRMRRASEPECTLSPSSLSLSSPDDR